MDFRKTVIQTLLFVSILKVSLSFEYGIFSSVFVNFSAPMATFRKFACRHGLRIADRRKKRIPLAYHRYSGNQAGFSNDHRPVDQPFTLPTITPFSKNFCANGYTIISGNADRTMQASSMVL